MLFNPFNKLDILLQLVSWILMILWINMLKLGTSLLLVQAKADSILQITNKRTTQRFPNHMYIFGCHKNMFGFFSIHIFNVYVCPISLSQHKVLVIVMFDTLQLNTNMWSYLLSCPKAISPVILLKVQHIYKTSIGICV